MSRLDPHYELLLAAGRFCVRPRPATHAELAQRAPAAREVYEILPTLYRQLVVAAERIAAAPPANWPLAVDGLSELVQAIGTSIEMGSQSAPTPNIAPAATAYRRPIICPHCEELSASPFVCDVCGQALQQNGEAA